VVGLGLAVGLGPGAAPGPVAAIARRDSTRRIDRVVIDLPLDPAAADRVAAWERAAVPAK
jgi:hypothetical protein